MSERQSQEGRWGGGPLSAEDTVSTYLPGTYRKDMGGVDNKEFWFVLFDFSTFFLFLSIFIQSPSQKHGGGRVRACDLLMRLGTTISVLMISEHQKNQEGWLLCVRGALWDQWEGSNRHKSKSRGAVIKIMLQVIYTDGCYFHYKKKSQLLEQGLLAHLNFNVWPV